MGSCLQKTGDAHPAFASHHPYTVSLRVLNVCGWAKVRGGAWIQARRVTFADPGSRTQVCGAHVSTGNVAQIPERGKGRRQGFFSCGRDMWAGSFGSERSSRGRGADSGG